MKGDVFFFFFLRFFWVLLLFLGGGWNDVTTSYQHSLFLKCSCIDCFLCSYFVVLTFGTSCFLVILVKLHDFMQLL